MIKKINQTAFGFSGAAVGALGMLLLGTLGNIGVYTGAVKMMQQWHMYFSISVKGIIAGMLEAAVVSFVAMYAIAWFYNKFNKNG